MSNFYNQASWVLVPSGIEEDIVFAQKPISGLGDLTFTRASDATYTDASGVVRRSPYNLLQQSETFMTTWVQVRSSISANTIVAPNGTLTADTLFDSIDNNIHYLSQTITAINGQATVSIYARAKELSQIQLAALGGTTPMGRGFDLSTGTTFSESIGGVGSNDLGQSITAVGNGWYRCTMSWTATGQTSIWILTSSGGAATYVGTGTNGVYIWGAQLVEGTSALDYFPTTNRQDVPRIDFRNADGTLSSCGRLLLEPQRTNSIRNSSMVGAVAGSPGTLPTNWSTSNAGLTRTIVDVGIENGLPYIDIRFNGIATSTVALVAFEGSSAITASVGQVWSSNAYVKNIATPAQANQVLLSIYEWNSVGAYLSEGSVNIRSQITTSLKRFDFVRTLASATTARVSPLIQFILTNGATYDFTIRIAAPQMELGAYATTWVPTTTAAVTRIADVASKTGVSSLIGQTEGTIYAEVNFNKNTSGIIFAINDGTATNRIYIQFITSTTLIANIRVAGVNLNFIATIPTIPATGGTYKVALAYKQNDYVFSLNGTNYISTDTRAVPATSRIDVGQSTGAGQLEGGVTQAILYPTRLDNATLAQMTTL